MGTLFGIKAFAVAILGGITNAWGVMVETVIEKLKGYEAIGVDAFIYYASMGLDLERQKRSLRLFIDDVMPAFA